VHVQHELIGQKRNLLSIIFLAVGRTVLLVDATLEYPNESSDRLSLLLVDAANFVEEQLQDLVAVSSARLVVRVLYSIFGVLAI